MPIVSKCMSVMRPPRQQSCQSWIVTLLKQLHEFWKNTVVFNRNTTSDAEIIDHIGWPVIQTRTIKKVLLVLLEEIDAI